MLYVALGAGIAHRDQQFFLVGRKFKQVFFEQLRSSIPVVQTAVAKKSRSDDRPFYSATARYKRVIDRMKCPL